MTSSQDPTWDYRISYVDGKTGTFSTDADNFVKSELLPDAYVFTEKDGSETHVLATAFVEVQRTVFARPNTTIWNPAVHEGSPN